MAKKYRYFFIVSGTGEFPTDMLRYDRCTPSTEQDSCTMAATFRKFRQGPAVQRDVVMQADRLPTEGRWNSYGWSVNQVQKREVG